MTDAPQYTGWLRKVNGEIVGEIRDQFQWPIRLKATPAPDGGYVLEGTLGAVPQALKLPMVDE